VSLSKPPNRWYSHKNVCVTLCSNHLATIWHLYKYERW